jgi:hypothetical protein
MGGAYAIWSFHDMVNVLICPQIGNTYSIKNSNTKYDNFVKISLNFGYWNCLKKMLILTFLIFNITFKL